MASDFPILEGAEGTQINSDGISVYAETVAGHDPRLFTVLERLVNTGVISNLEKSKISGIVIDEQGIHIDEEGIKTIKEMGPSENSSDVRSINHLARFIPH